MKTHRDVIDLWKTRSSMARDLDIKPERVRKWYQRGNIPSDFWVEVSEMAMIGVEELARMKK